MHDYFNFLSHVTPSGKGSTARSLFEQQIACYKKKEMENQNKCEETSKEDHLSLSKNPFLDQFKQTECGEDAYLKNKSDKLGQINKDVSGFWTIDKSISAYSNMEIQPMTAMQSWMPKEQYKGFVRGNVIKYVARYEVKGGVEDLKKAKDYLYELIKLEESKG